MAYYPSYKFVPESNYDLFPYRYYFLGKEEAPPKFRRLSDWVYDELNPVPNFRPSVEEKRRVMYAMFLYELVRAHVNGGVLTMPLAKTKLPKVFGSRPLVVVDHLCTNKHALTKQLSDAGYIEVYVGRLHHGQTCIKATDKLISRFKEILGEMEVLKTDDVFLRGPKKFYDPNGDIKHLKIGKHMPVGNHPQIRRERRILSAYNRNNYAAIDKANGNIRSALSLAKRKLGKKMNYDDMPTLTAKALVTYRIIHTDGSIKMHGRMYSDAQNIKKKYRLEFYSRLFGEEYVGLDHVSMAPRLVYNVFAGIEAPEDCYSKIVVTKEEIDKYDADELFDLIMSRFPKEIADAVQSKVNAGCVMFQENRVTLLTIEKILKWQRDNGVCFAFFNNHDCFEVPKRYKDVVKECMEEAYREHTGFDTKVSMYTKNEKPKPKDATRELIKGVWMRVMFAHGRRGIKMSLRKFFKSQKRNLNFTLAVDANGTSHPKPPWQGVVYGEYRIRPPTYLTAFA